MRITSLGQNSAHKDHNHMALLGISTSLARCVGNIQIIHTDPLWSYKPTLHKILIAELYASLACFFQLKVLLLERCPQVKQIQDDLPNRQRQLLQLFSSSPT